MPFMARRQGTTFTSLSVINIHRNEMTASSIIRRCTEEDMVVVTRLLREDLDKTEDKNRGFWFNVKLMHRSLDCMWVLVDDDDAIQGICLTEMDGYTPAIVWVDEASRGKGHGAALVRHMERAAIVAGQTEMSMMILEESRPFWHMLGYDHAVDGRRREVNLPNRSYCPPDEMRWVKDLTNSQDAGVKRDKWIDHERDAHKRYWASVYGRG